MAVKILLTQAMWGYIDELADGRGSLAELAGSGEQLALAIKTADEKQHETLLEQIVRELEWCAKQPVETWLDVKATHPELAERLRVALTTTRAAMG